MEYASERHIGDILKERNIILKGADIATAQGFTQVPNFLLKSKTLSAGDKMTFAMLLSYAWQNDYCFPGQERLAKDLGLSDRSVRTHLKSLQAQGLLAIKRRGQGKTNIYELNLTPKRSSLPHQTGRKRPV
jgi:biotin operon repressor